MTMHELAFLDATAQVDLVWRYRRAGLIILGKTNPPEFAPLPTTEPRPLWRRGDVRTTGRTAGTGSSVGRPETAGVSDRTRIRVGRG